MRGDKICQVKKSFILIFIALNLKCLYNKDVKFAAQRT